MRVAIVEDCLIDIANLKGCIEEYSRQSGKSFDIDIFQDPVKFASSYSCNYDLIFFDIEMPGMNGIQTAEKIRELDNEVVIVFVTNLGQYAIEGYSVGAADFILKPVNIYSFKLKFERILSRIKTDVDDFLLIKADGKTIKINIDDINYIEVLGHYLNYVVNGVRYEEYSTLKSIESKLAKHHFVKCHRSYLINLSKVDSVQKDQITVNGEKIQIARPQKKAFLEALSDYMGGR